MRIHVMGTTSGAGKTVIAAMICRFLSRNGYDVAPFKASNLSDTSFTVPGGGEIGIGQAFQALASGIPPETDMNPVLLRPTDGRIVTMVNGYCTNERPEDLMKVVLDAFDRISSKHDVIVCEGSGSPAELNMRDRDLANVRLARERDIPVVLVGDIDRGGVFAGLYGTWLLVPEEDRHLLKGFIINRFRGDASILGAGIGRIEELTGMRCIGVMPMANLKFPDEDSLQTSVGRLDGGPDADDAYLRNLDELTEYAEKGLDMEMLMRIMEAQ